MKTYAVTNPEQHFHLQDGTSLASLDDLFAELQTMDENVFFHHVTADKNDFANWVQDVMDDRPLARDIKLTRERDQLLKLLFINLFR